MLYVEVRMCTIKLLYAIVLNYSDRLAVCGSLERCARFYIIGPEQVPCSYLFTTCVAVCNAYAIFAYNGCKLIFDVSWIFIEIAMNRLTYGQ